MVINYLKHHDHYREKDTHTHTKATLFSTLKKNKIKIDLFVSKLRKMKNKNQNLYSNTDTVNNLKRSQCNYTCRCRIQHLSDTRTRLI